MTYKHLFFDFDGVIVDSFDLSYQAHLAVTPNPHDLPGYRAMFHGNVYKSEQHHEETEADREAVRQDPFFKVYTPRLLEQAPMAGMPETLQRLAAQRTLAIVTSSITSPIQSYLDRYDLAAHFDTVLGADIHKSKIRKMNMLCELYDVAPEKCLFITDTLGDMREAAKAGLPAIGVAWGFHEIETLKQGNPVAIVSSPAELFTTVDRLS